MNRGMSFRGSRRLSELGERIAEGATEYLPEEDHARAATVAEELATNDDLLRDVVEAETLLSRQANARRKETADPWGDELLLDLKELRGDADDVVAARVEELTEETVEAVEDLRDVEEESDDGVTA